MWGPWPFPPASPARPALCSTKSPWGNFSGSSCQFPPTNGLIDSLAGIVQPFPDNHRLQRDHLARLSRLLEAEGDRRAFRMLREPLGHVAFDIRVDRIEVPAAVRSVLFLEVGEGVLESRISAISH